jgi:oligopeptide transport system substrate-binding protein
LAPRPLRRRLALAAALLAAALAGCHRTAQRTPCPAGQVCLEYGVATEPLTLDPQLATAIDEARVIGDLMIGLTTEAADGTTAPGLAERWETSPDGLVWTFHLRPATWSDGAPVTADDFVFAYRRILDPHTAAPYAYLVYVLKNGQAVNAGRAPPEAVGARALDPRTLQLTLAHPAPYLPQLLKHHSFYPVPAHAVRAYGDAWVRPGRYVSDGPYRLTGWRLGDRIQVVKNPRFFDAAHVCISRITYHATPDATAAERQVATGELDLETLFQSNRIDHIRKSLPGYARPHLWQDVVYMSFNTRDPGPLRDRRVRRALSEAVDRDFMTAKLMRAGQRPAVSFVTPGTAGALPGPRTQWAALSFPARQAEARALLAQAGYGRARPLRIELATASASDGLLLAQAIQADWRAVGVDARVTQSEGQILLANLRNRAFQTAISSWIADFDDPVTFLGLFKSDTGAQNYGDYRNPAFDRLLTAADEESDGGVRARLLAQAEQMLLDDEAVGPLYFGVSRNLVNPEVTGFVDNLQDIHRARWLCRR